VTATTPTPSTPRDALDAAIAAAEDVLDPGPLRRARAALDAPWSVAVVGRLGVGKSTLVSKLTDTEQPTGLGGVTAAPTVVVREDTRWVDTPGIDDPDAAIRHLGPVLDAADAVVWVVDGLQPVTASERAVLHAIVPPDTPLRIVISKRDLIDPAERGAVIARVTAHGAVWSAEDIRCCDLRAVDAELAVVLASHTAHGVRRIDAVRRALEEANTALGAPLTLERAMVAWSEAVRALVQRLGDAGADALSSSAREAHDAVRALIGQEAPTLPRPVPGAQSLRAAAGRWLMEGEVVLQDWWSGDDERQRQVERWRTLRAALDALAAALVGLSG